MVKASPTKEARSLIDASEKPLRRSPPGMPHDEEEWPVLFPEKPTTPDTLRQLNHQDSSRGSPKLTHRQGERYPVLPSAAYHPISKPEGSTMKASSMPKVERKEVASTNAPNLFNTSVDVNDTGNPAVNPDQKTENRDTAPAQLVKPNTLGTYVPDRSAGAAAVEKSAEESKPTNQTRQTRTSSLRARLSAGKLIKDPTGRSKIMGFTDFTNVKEPFTQDSEGSLRASKGPIYRSVSPSNARPPASKSSKDSLCGNRAPAQFVAGSRRPTHRRPSSRGSLRSESRASSPLFAPKPPARSVPDVPHATHELPVAVTVDSEKSQIIGERRSSIPVLRHTSNPIKNSKDESKEKEFAQPKKVFRDEFSIYEDKSTHHSVALQSIKESPRQNYEIKRLSMTSPEHGPTLRISPSADRLIMGTGPDKENQPKSSKYRSKEIRRAAVASELVKAKDKVSSASLNTPVQRPSSSQGFPLSTSRKSLFDINSREKKARSIDVSFLLPNSHAKKHSMAQTPKSSHNNTGSSGGDDPFFDATEGLDDSVAGADATDLVVTQTCNDEHVRIAEDEPWIFPMPNPDSSTAYSDSTPVTSGYLPITLQEHLGKGIKANYEKPIARQPYGQARDLSCGSSELPNKIDETLDLPATPDQVGHAAQNFSSGSFPPRSSSHTAHPDYTTDGSAKVSPLSPLSRTNRISRTFLGIDDIDPGTAAKFNTRQNNLGSLGGLASSQIDTTNPTMKRASTARESNKSQGSLSKGMLSNFRGLFNKRSSENTEPSSLRSNRKGKQVRVTSNGSPFPSISEVHPMHRPTLASMNRAKAVAAANDGMKNPPTPSFASPIPSEVSKTTTLAMQILDSARTERSTPKQRRLLELGTIMVDAVTQARDAEKAMEEAKQAARQAEVAYAKCKKSLGDVTRCVEEWKDAMVTM